MLTGRRVFDGDDVADVLANVIKEPPPWQALPADTPAAIRRLRGDNEIVYRSEGKVMTVAVRRSRSGHRRRSSSSPRAAPAVSPYTVVVNWTATLGK